MKSTKTRNIAIYYSIELLLFCLASFIKVNITITMIFLKIKRDIQFNLSQTKNTKNPVQTSVTSIRKTKKTCKNQQIFTRIDYSLFNTKT